MKKTTSERLNEIMQLKKLKQIDIINMCKNNPFGIKLNKSDLSQYVSGKFLPKQDKLTLLSYVLNVSEAWLMGYDVPMEKAKTSISDINSLKDTNNFSEKQERILKEVIIYLSIADDNGLNQLESYINFLKSQNNN